MSFIDVLDNYVVQARRTQAEAELTRDRIRAFSNNGGGSTGPVRVQKCPICGDKALSEGAGEPYVCTRPGCGWRSDKVNGGGGGPQ